MPWAVLVALWAAVVAVVAAGGACLAAAVASRMARRRARRGGKQRDGPSAAPVNCINGKASKHADYELNGASWWSVLLQALGLRSKAPKCQAPMYAVTTTMHAFPVGICPMSHPLDFASIEEEEAGEEEAVGAGGCCSDSSSSFYAGAHKRCHHAAEAAAAAAPPCTPGAPHPKSSSALASLPPAPAASAAATEPDPVTLSPPPPQPPRRRSLAARARAPLAPLVRPFAALAAAAAKAADDALALAASVPRMLRTLSWAVRSGIGYKRFLVGVDPLMDPEGYHKGLSDLHDYWAQVRAGSGCEGRCSEWVLVRWNRVKCNGWRLCRPRWMAFVKTPSPPGSHPSAPVLGLTTGMDRRNSMSSPSFHQTSNPTSPPRATRPPRTPHPQQLVEVCRLNGGVYVKAGQFAAAFASVPIEYRKHLALLMVRGGDGGSVEGWGGVVGWGPCGCR